MPDHKTDGGEKGVRITLSIQNTAKGDMARETEQAEIEPREESEMRA